jgi:hypothetical protein
LTVYKAYVGPSHGFFLLACWQELDFREARHNLLEELAKRKAAAGQKIDPSAIIVFPASTCGTCQPEFGGQCDPGYRCACHRLNGALCYPLADWTEFMRVFDVLSIPELTEVSVVAGALSPAAIGSIDYLELGQNHQQDERAMPVPKHPETGASPGLRNLEPLTTAGDISSRSTQPGAAGGSLDLPNTRSQRSAAFGFKGRVQQRGSK